MKKQPSRLHYAPISALFHSCARFGWLAALVWLAPPLPVSGQIVNNCQPLDCSVQFYVQIVPDPDYPNTSGCQPFGSAPCGGGDQFRQLFYKVQLVYFPLPPDNTTTFDLQYTELKVNVELGVENPVAGGGYSFIDTKATQSCYEAWATANGWETATDDGNGGWTNGANFIAGEKNVDILFSNAQLPCPEAAVIHFSPPSGNCPNGATLCAVTDLFRVVVNAYPGEDVSLKSVFATYNTYGEGTCSLDLSSAEATATALLPNTSFNTSNANVKVRLKDPTPTSSGGCNVEVEVVNLNSFAIDVDYLEFVVKMDANQAMTPEVTSAYDRPLLSNGMTHYIHFIVPDEGWNLAANGGTQSIGTIAILPPLLSNAGWDASLTLDDGTKSRIKTPNACTRLPFSDPVQSCQDAGDPQCAFGSEGVVFTVEGLSANDCSLPFTKKIKLGFKDVDLGDPQILVLRDLVFSVVFDITGDVQFQGANFPSNWTPVCPVQSICLSSPCYEVVSSANTIQFNYCVSIPLTETNFIQISPTPDAFAEIVFEGGGCINSASITSLSLRRNGDPSTCIPLHSEPPYSGIPICQDEIYGTIATETGEGVEGVSVEMTISSNGQPSGCDAMICPSELFNGTAGTGNTGSYGFCPCEECQYFDIKPSKDGNDLNGVSTYDLVLISKHILGLEPLGSPYKIIAADANSSGSVTTFDIVEIRKLILGIYNEFLDNTSWRFVLSDYVFPTPGNPFASTFPEHAGPVDMAANASNKADFVAIKVGDVNNSAFANRPSDNRPEATLSWSGTQRTGDILTVPVVYSGGYPLDAFQAGFRFDPALLQLIGPSQGDLPAYNADCFGLTNVKSGEIRTLWLSHDPGDREMRIKPGDVLFYLTFKVLGPLSESGLPLQLDDAVLPNAAWRPDGTACTLVYAGSVPAERNEQDITTPALLKARCQPNPSGGEVTFQVQSVKPGKGRIALFGPWGNRVFVRDVVFEGGEQEFFVPEIGQLPNGVYIWKVYAGGEKTQGHLVKQ